MDAEQFKYDVAFSFSGEDEPKARQLNDLLTGRFKTFIYSDVDRQAEIVGADGADKFSEVFARESRTVVVLFRKGWGDASFTAVESTAIRNRAYLYGWDFATFVALESSPTLPAWFPRHRIWFDSERWGIESAAAILAARIQESGGRPMEQTIADVAARTRAAIEAEGRRAGFALSQEGLDAMTEEFHVVVAALEAGARECLDLVKFEKHNATLASVDCGGRSASVVFDHEYYGTTKGSRLRIVERQRKAAVEEDAKYRFDRINERNGWTREDDVETLISSANLADEIVKRLLRLRASDARRQRAQSL